MSAATLSRDAALAIAASCRERLCACGAVIISQQPLIASVDSDSFAWLEIAVDDELDNALRWSHLREAVDVLHALSRCAGYAPYLNAAFWRDALGVAGVGGSLSDQLSARFGSAFPQFRLIFTHDGSTTETPEEEANRLISSLRQFFFCSASSSSRTAEFDATMAKLRPFQSPSRQAPLKIALSLPSMDTQWLLPATATLTADLSKDPTVIVMEITLNHRRHRPHDPLEGLSWLRDLTSVSCFSDWTLDDEIDNALVFGQLHRRVLGLGDDHSMPIRTLHVDRSSISDIQFGGLCSALPFTTSVRYVRIFTDPDWSWNTLSSPYDWAWLGYALFHTKTDASTWQGLVLEGCGITLNDAAVVEQVARCGASALREYVTLDGPENGASHENRTVLVAPGAEICCATTLHPVATTTGTFSTMQLDAWPSTSHLGCVSVVYPGVGIAVVKIPDTTTPHSPPSLATNDHYCGVKALTVANHSSIHGSAAGLDLFIHTCGSALRSLDLLHHDDLNAIGVYRILGSCPQLEQVALNHDGTLWSSPLLPRAPTLKAIRLRCSLVEAYCVVSALCEAAKAAFPNAQALYFHVTRGAGIFHSISKAVGAHLLGNPTIQDFAMVKERHSTSMSRLTNDRLAKSLVSMRLSLSDPIVSQLPANERFKTRLRAIVEPILVIKGVPVEVCTKVVCDYLTIRDRYVWIDLL